MSYSIRKRLQIANVKLSFVSITPRAIGVRAQIKSFFTHKTNNCSHSHTHTLTHSHTHTLTHSHTHTLTHSHTHTLTHSHTHTLTHSHTHTLTHSHTHTLTHSHTHTSSGLGNSYRYVPQLEVSVFKSPTSLDPRRYAGSNGCKQALCINIYVTVVP